METTRRTRREFLDAVADKWPNAVAKARQIIDKSKSFKKSGSHSSDVAIIASISKSLGGESWNTGGGCVVGHFLVDKSTWIEMDAYGVVVVHTSRPTRRKVLVRALADLTNRWCEEPGNNDSIGFFWSEK